MDSRRRGREKNLEKLIDELDLKNSVVLKPATKNIESIYRKASLFLFTSRMEGFGMVLLEAMSFGIPCISFDCPSGPRDIIKNNKNGFLIKNGDMKEFVSKVNYFINNVEALQSFGKNAYDTVIEWDNLEIYRKWKSVFK